MAIIVIWFEIQLAMIGDLKCNRDMVRAVGWVRWAEQNWRDFTVGERKTREREREREREKERERERERESERERTRERER